MGAAPTNKRRRTYAPPNPSRKKACKDVSQARVKEARTLHNQQVSPILRLPAELRAKIREYAYGTRTVHVVVRGSPRSPLVTYSSCHEALPGLAVAPVSNAALGVPVLASPHGDFPGSGSHYNCLDEGLPVRVSQKPVCKQQYYEARAIAWQTTTFYVNEYSYRALPCSLNITTRNLITQLTIYMSCGSPPWPWSMSHLIHTLEAEVTFPALKGLHLIVNMFEYESGANSLENPPLFDRALLRCVRKFQQAQQVPGRTSVWIEPRRALKTSYHAERLREVANTLGTCCFGTIPCSARI